MYGFWKTENIYMIINWKTCLNILQKMFKKENIKI